MKRRDFITLCGGGAVAAPFAVNAQQKTMPVVGVLYPWSAGPKFSPRPDPGNDGPLHRGLRETGFTDGQNVVFEYRFAEGHYDRLPALAAELVKRKVDVIITFPGTPAAMAAKRATSTIPVVFAAVGDPVGVGLVASLARPGGNVTGFANMNATLTLKGIDLLVQLVPRASTIGFLVNPSNPVTELYIRNTEETARLKGLNLSVQKASTEAEIDAAFTSFVQLHVDALVVMDDSFLMSGGRKAQIAEVALRDGIPAAGQALQFAADGGLITYGVDEADEVRQAGIYAGRILKGARLVDLPVQQPTVFKMIINLKTAKALGLIVPPSILVAADEVIE